MDVLEAIKTRRSIREYTGEVISNEDLKMILEAGFQAPSAHNFQPWHFIVVKEKEKLEKIKNTHPYAKMVVDAGCVIIVCGDQTRQKQTGFLVEDCSAAIQNMLLCAHGLNLGSVWCGLYPVTQLTTYMKSLLNIPEKIIPVGMVVVGHKTKDRDVSYRYDETKVHYEEWI